MGNLLSYVETFKWEDLSVDRSSSIINLNEVILESKNYDQLFKSKDFDNVKLSWGNFIEFIYYYGYDSNMRKSMFPWMTQLQHLTLIQILKSFKNSTSIDFNNLDDLKVYSNSQFCEYIGFKDGYFQKSYISCLDTYFSFHNKIVSSFNRSERLHHKEYFLKFYTPKLTVEANNINQTIRRRLCPNAIIRLDTPSLDPNGAILHGEQIQVHFSNGSALYIDGTWKHGSLNLTEDICNTLVEWGFILPENIT